MAGQVLQEIRTHLVHQLPTEEVESEDRCQAEGHSGHAGQHQQGAQNDAQHLPCGVPRRLAAGRGIGDTHLPALLDRTRLGHSDPQGDIGQHRNKAIAVEIPVAVVAVNRKAHG